MKLGTRALPSHASSVQTTTSTECFRPDGQGYKSSFRKGPAFSLKGLLGLTGKGTESEGHAP